ncbi:hypothetical protein [Nocardioides sp.]|uniref:hypothetical protein n=1 Tax=Nocardioides sp. TaxID=35761 RepID=UPI002ED0ACD9
MTWPWQWAAASNERAVENARQASTALSRGRVEREEVELFLRERYAEPRPVAAVPGQVPLEPGVARAAR